MLTCELYQREFLESGKPEQCKTEVALFTLWQSLHVHFLPGTGSRYLHV